MDSRNHNIASEAAVARMNAEDRKHFHPVPDEVAKMNRAQRRAWAKANGWPKSATQAEARALSPQETKI